MAYETFYPIVPPSPGTSDKPEIKLLEAEFGDGYSQAVPDGINHIRRNMSLSWDLLTPSQASVIIDFFIARKGCEPFWWTPSDEITPIKWVCKDWDSKKTTGGFIEISAKLKQSFLL